MMNVPAGMTLKRAAVALLSLFMAAGTYGYIAGDDIDTAIKDTILPDKKAPLKVNDSVTPKNDSETPQTKTTIKATITKKWIGPGPEPKNIEITLNASAPRITLPEEDAVLRPETDPAKQRIVKKLIDAIEDTRLPPGKRIEKIGKLSGMTSDPAAVDALIELIKSGDKEMANAAVEGLTTIGDVKVIAPLRKKIVQTATKRGDTASLKAALAGMEERVTLRDGIQKEHGATVQDHPGQRFSNEQLRLIDTALDDVKLPRDIAVIRTFIAGEKKGDGPVGTYSPEWNDIAVDAGQILTFFYATIVHETMHAVDDKLYGMKAFDDLYARSFKDKTDFLDFQHEFGATNAKEDFATTAKTYVWNTQKLSLEAIDRAEKGRPMLLEKILTVLDLFSRGHPETASLFYHTADKESGAITATGSATAQLTRDKSGRITAIDGVNVYNKDGSYNTAGLRDYFNGLKFNGAGAQ